VRYILLFGNGIGLTTMTITLVALHLRDFVTRWNLARGSEGYVEYDEGPFYRSYFSGLVEGSKV
jgi:hypothetical protein